MTDAPPAPESASGVLSADPSARLNEAYRAVARRMAGLGFVNPAVDVEAVDFAPWDSHWLGVMVTPWFINLMLVPRDPQGWTSLPQGEKLRYHFPAGDYDFISSRDATIGEYHMCSLISPLLHIPDHATAREVARLAREALLDAANAPVPEAPAAEQPGPLARMKEQAEAPMSKRDFLRGRFLRERAE